MIPMLGSAIHSNGADEYVCAYVNMYVYIYMYVRMDVCMHTWTTTIIRDYLNNWGLLTHGHKEK